MSGFRTRKVLTLLDSSGNNPVLAKRISMGAVNGAVRKSNVINYDNHSFRKSNEVKPRLESRTKKYKRDYEPRQQSDELSFNETLQTHLENLPKGPVNLSFENLTNINRMKKDRKTNVKVRNHA